MSQAAPAPTRDEEMLARLAELDLAAAEKVHGKLMAAEAAGEIADLGRTYQRLARSLRQTLALKAKLARDRALGQTPAANPLASAPHFLVDERAMALQDAVDRVAEAAAPGDEARREALADRFDRELDDWIEQDDFCTADLDAQVLRACRLLDLPEDLATRWRTLPAPVYPPDPAAPDPEDAADTPPPWSDSG